MMDFETALDWFRSAHIARCDQMASRDADRALLRRIVGDPRPAYDAAESFSDSPVGSGSGRGVRHVRLVNSGISPRFETPEQSSAKLKWLEYVANQAPVTGFRVMKNDILTVRAARNPEELAERLEDSKRGKIKCLSMASRRRLAVVAANTEVVMRSFVTVTYPASFPCDGELCKQHLAALLEALRRKCGKPSYLWFLEFQKRGAPHFHIFLSVALPEPLENMNRKSGRVRKVVRTNRRWQDWLSKRWYRIVGSGDEKHLRAGAAWEVIEKSDGCARYVSKEAYKTFQKIVPDGFQNVGRFWGCSRDVPPDEGKLVPSTESEMRRIFGESCAGPEGIPFPVIFGAADTYKKIAGTSQDPVKRRQWKRTKKGKTSDLMNIPNTFRQQDFES